MANVYLAFIMCSFTSIIIWNFHGNLMNLALFSSYVQMRKLTFQRSWVISTKIYSASRWWSQTWTQAIWLQSPLLLTTTLSVKSLLNSSDVSRALKDRGGFLVNDFLLWGKFPELDFYDPSSPLLMSKDGIVCCSSQDNGASLSPSLSSLPSLLLFLIFRKKRKQNKGFWSLFKGYGLHKSASLSSPIWMHLTILASSFH